MENDNQVGWGWTFREIGSKDWLKTRELKRLTNKPFPFFLELTERTLE